MNKCVAALALSTLIFSCSSKPTASKVGTETIKKEISKDAQKDVQSAESISAETNSVATPNVGVKPVTAVSENETGYAVLEKAIFAKNDEKIREISLELLQINKTDYKALNALAMFHYNNRQTDAAVLLLKRAIAVNPKTSTAYNNLGLVALLENKKSEALRMFRKAIELDSKNYFAAANSAAIYAQEKDYQKVIFSFEKFSNSEKMNVDSLNNYAISLSAVGKNKEAAEVFERNFKKNSDSKIIMQNYAIFLIEKQAKYKEGLDLLNRLKFVGVEKESRQVIKNLESKAKAGLK